MFLPNESATRVLSDVERLTEERIDEVVNEFLEDFKEGSLQDKHWARHFSAYKLSKAAMNAYTRIIAKKYPSFCVNCVCPGYTRTDIVANTGRLSAAEGAESPVKLALLPDGGPSEVISSCARRKCAIVSGANKGIGFEICKQLAEKGIMVVMTARDEKRGLEALQKLIINTNMSSFADLSDRVVFHQLDVADQISVNSLVDFIKTRFGKLDILINNAAINGLIIEGDVLILKQLLEDHGYRMGAFDREPQVKPNGKIIETYELAKECLQINYYGAKRMVEAFIPLLQLSDSPRIVNVTSGIAILKFLCNEWAIGVLSDVERLNEEKIDEVLNEFLKDFKDGSIEAKNWPNELSAYKLSKAAMNGYTRIIAKRHTNFYVNCATPGYVRTEMTGNTGRLSVEEGAESIVKLALLPHGGPSGLCFRQHNVLDF